MKAQYKIFAAYALVLFASASAFAQTRVFSSADNQSESYIAVNPTNPNNIIIAAITVVNGYNRIGAYYTTNGGQSWSGSDDVIIYLSAIRCSGAWQQTVFTR